MAVEEFALPEARPDDDEDVVWGLSTASALWGRGERRDALVWIRRASEAAEAAGQAFRASELGMYATEIEERLTALAISRGEDLADTATDEHDLGLPPGYTPASRYGAGVVQSRTGQLEDQTMEMPAVTGREAYPSGSFDRVVPPPPVPPFVPPDSATRPGGTPPAAAPPPSFGSGPPPLPPEGVPPSLSFQTLPLGHTSPVAAGVPPASAGYAPPARVASQQPPPIPAASSGYPAPPAPDPGYPVYPPTPAEPRAASSPDASPPVWQSGHTQPMQAVPMEVAMAVSRQAAPPPPPAPAPPPPEPVATPRQRSDPQAAPAAHSVVSTTPFGVELASAEGNLATALVAAAGPPPPTATVTTTTAGGQLKKLRKPRPPILDPWTENVPDDNTGPSTRQRARTITSDVVVSMMASSEDDDEDVVTSAMPLEVALGLKPATAPPPRKPPPPTSKGGGAPKPPLPSTRRKDTPPKSDEEPVSQPPVSRPPVSQAPVSQAPVSSPSPRVIATTPVVPPVEPSPAPAAVRPPSSPPPPRPPSNPPPARPGSNPPAARRASTLPPPPPPESAAPRRSAPPPAPPPDVLFAKASAAASSPAAAPRVRSEAPTMPDAPSSRSTAPPVAREAPPPQPVPPPPALPTEARAAMWSDAPGPSVPPPPPAHTSSPPGASSRPASSSPPPSASPPTVPPAQRTVAGVRLDRVPLLSDLPAEQQVALASGARIEDLEGEQDVGGFGLALVVSGSAAVCAAVNDAMASRATTGSLVVDRSSLDGGSTVGDTVRLRLVAQHPGAKVALWDRPVIESALKDCPWVLDELSEQGDRLKGRAGATLGPLGQLDETTRMQVLQALTVRKLPSHGQWVDKGERATGITVVGVGTLEVGEGVAAELLGPGDLLFASNALDGAAAPARVVAAEGGALILVGDRRVAQELFALHPHLIELFASQ